MAINLKRRCFTVEEYHRMGEAGILTDEDRVELIDGEIVEMTPIGLRHASCVMFLNQVFTLALVGRAVVSPQGPLRLGERLEFQPDIVLLRPPLESYRLAIPTAADALLVVEVADTSLDRDRGIKLLRYARANVPEVWIVDLAGETVEVHRTPAPEGYRDSERVLRGGSVSPAAFPDLLVAVADILG
jgi:Uma2 family endonuclease